jgi:hypothetical protein
MRPRSADLVIGRMRHLCLDGVRPVSDRQPTRFFVTYAAAPSFLAHSVALFAMYYNFVRIHKTLRTPPALAADVTKRLWEIDVVDVLEAWEAVA